MCLTALRRLPFLTYTLGKVRSVSTPENSQPVLADPKLALVGAGVGLALLEHGEVQDAAREGQLVVWGTEPIPCDLSLAYAAERAHDPLIKAVALEVLQVWNH